MPCYAVSTLLPASCSTREYGNLHAFQQSGRQDLNLRPPGPQPGGSGAPQSDAPMSAGISVSGLLSVSLSLFPVLFPVGANASLTIATSRSDGA